MKDPRLENLKYSIGEQFIPRNKLEDSGLFEIINIVEGLDRKIKYHLKASSSKILKELYMSEQLIDMKFILVTRLTTRILRNL